MKVWKEQEEIVRILSNTCFGSSFEDFEFGRKAGTENASCLDVFLSNVMFFVITCVKII